MLADKIIHIPGETIFENLNIFLNWDSVYQSDKTTNCSFQTIKYPIVGLGVVILSDFNLSLSQTNKILFSLAKLFSGSPYTVLGNGW